MAFPDALRAARKKLGWSQAEMAKKLRVSAGTYGDWESGARHKASLDRVEIIAKICGDEVARALVDQTLGKRAAKFR